MIVNGFKTKAAAIRHLKENGHDVASALSRPESNPKVAKNGKLGVLSAPLHLAPFDLSGFNTCAQASKGCIKACLHRAGNPAYMDGKERSRIARTKAYFQCRDAFMALLVFEIEALRVKAAKMNMEAAVRLNATSDLPWENRNIILHDKATNSDVITGLMHHFADVQFYDYTKITKRAVAAASGYHANGVTWPSNYHLTFSKTEANDADCIKVLQAGGNVAVVFMPKTLPTANICGMQASKGQLVVAGGPMSADWGVFDGDETDYRPKDPKGVIVALKAKGPALKDTSGFVVA